MQKLLKKDKKLRSKIKHLEGKYYILKSILTNFNYFILVRWNALLKVKFLQANNYKHKTIHKCLHGINKTRFNKLTVFSRHVFLKLIRQGNISGMKRSNW